MKVCSVLRRLPLGAAFRSACGSHQSSLYKGETEAPEGSVGKVTQGPRMEDNQEGWVALGGLTDQDEDTDQEGDEGAGAEGGSHDEGCGVAGLDGPGAVTAADADGECACAAERGRPAVHHEDGQEEHVLLLPVEAHVLYVHCGCVVCSRGREWRVTWGQGQPSPSQPPPDSTSKLDSVPWISASH